MVQSKVGWLCPNCGHAELTPGAVEAQTVMPVATPEQTAPDPNPPAAAAPTAPTPPDSVVSKSNVGMVSTEPPPKSHVPRTILFIMLPVLLLLGLGAYGYQEVQVTPKHALTQYVVNLASSNTGQYNGTVSFVSEDQTLLDYKSNVTLNGQYDVKDKANPKLDLKLDATIGQGGGKAEIISLDKTLYFRIESLTLSFLSGLSIPKDWYKYSLDQNLLSDKCSTQSNKSNSLFGRRVLSEIPVKDAKLVNYFDKVNGHAAKHYRGTIDLSKLPAMVDAANKDLPADCKITLTQDEVKNLTITYDLWNGKDFGRLSLVAKDSKSKSTVNATFDTSAYNKPVSIKAPDGAKDVKELLDSFGGGDYKEPEPTIDVYSPSKAPDGYRQYSASSMADNPSFEAAHVELEYIYKNNDLGDPPPFTIREFRTYPGYKPPKDCGDFEPLHDPIYHQACSAIGKAPGGQPIYFMAISGTNEEAAYALMGSTLVTVQTTSGNQLDPAGYLTIFGSLQKKAWADIKQATSK